MIALLTVHGRGGFRSGMTHNGMVFRVYKNSPYLDLYLVFGGR